MEVEIEVFELFADEADGQNGDLLDDEVFTSDVGGNFLGNSFPLIAWNFDAANGCNDLHLNISTLAAALLMDFSPSRSVFNTISLKAERLGAARVDHR